jgi:AraC-like DNA-binding protein
MAHDNQKEKRRFIEFNNLFVDYTDGDVVIFDNVRDLASLQTIKPMINLIVLCTGGGTTIEANGTKAEMKKGDIFLCPPQTKIRTDRPETDFSCKTLCLSDHIIQGLLRDKADIWHRAVYGYKLNLMHLSSVGLEEFGFYYALIQSKTKQREQQAPYEIVQALIRALLLELCFLLEGENALVSEKKLSQGKLLFNKFLKLVSSNDVKRQPITQYASKLAITPKYLTMLCLKYSDKTASEWVIQYTIEDIRFYLRNSNLSIKEISAKLGFSNMSHFGSYVRKHLGVSPSEFRDRQ